MTILNRPFLTGILRKATLAVLVAGMTAAGRAAIPPTEQLLPADTLFVACVPDMAKARQTFKQSPMGQLLNDPAMKPFCDKFSAKFHEQFAEPLQRDLGIKLDDFMDLAKGQVALALTQNGWTGQGGAVPGMVILMDSRDKSAQLKTMLGKLRKSWVDAGKSVRTDKVRDVEFTVIMMASNDVPKALTDFLPKHQETQELGKDTDNKPAAKTEIYIGQYESLLVVGDSAKTVEKVVMHLTGGSAPALADQEAFEADRLALMRDAQSYTWFNTKKFFEVVSSIPPEAPNPDAPTLTPQFDLGKLLPALGLTGLKTVACSTHYGAGGFAADIFIGAPESTRAGLFKLIAAENKDSNPPAFVPADVIKFQRWRFDGQKTIATAEKIMGDISPQALNLWNYFISMATTAQKEKDPDFDLRKDVFGNLGDDLVMYSKASQSADSAGTRSIFLIGSPNPDKLAGSLRAVLSILAPANTPKQRDFLGRKIYSFELPSRGMAMGSNGAPQSLNYAASGGYVAISTDAGMLEEYLRSSDGKIKPLRELPGFGDAAEKVGGQNTGQFGYENLTEEVRLLFGLLKTAASADQGTSPTFNPLAGTMPFSSPNKTMKEWLDFSLLPDFSDVSKYFSFSMSSGTTTPNGLDYKVFIPDPPNLK